MTQSGDGNRKTALKKRGQLRRTLVRPAKPELPLLPRALGGRCVLGQPQRAPKPSGSWPTLRFLRDTGPSLLTYVKNFPDRGANDCVCSPAARPSVAKTPLAVWRQK